MKKEQIGINYDDFKIGEIFLSYNEEIYCGEDWLLCDGCLVDKNKHSELYHLLKDYGYCVPDLRGNGYVYIKTK